MKKKKVLAVVAIICILTSMTLPVMADGARYWTYGMRYKSFAVKSYSSMYNDTWDAILDNARAAWNNSGAGVTITTSSASNHQILAMQYEDTWYGLLSVNSSSQTYITQFTMYLNARTIKNAATNYSNFARSTTVHEFGHTLFLDDNPPTTSASIMKYDRNRNTMVAPQSYDVNGVNAKYDLIP